MEELIKNNSETGDVLTISTLNLTRSELKKLQLPVGKTAEYYCIELAEAYERENFAIRINGGAGILHLLIGAAIEMRFEDRVMLTGDTSKQVKIEKSYINLCVSGEIVGINFEQAFDIVSKLSKLDRKFESISDFIAMDGKDWKSYLSAYMILNGFWLEKSTGQWFITQQEAGPRNVTHYECAVSTASKQRGGGSFACPSDWLEPEESLLKYLPEIRAIASKYKGMQAFLNFLLNGWIAEQELLGIEFDLVKAMVRVGLLMSSGEAKDISTTLRFKSFGSLKLPLEQVLPFAEEYVKKTFNTEAKRKAFLRTFVKNYKEDKLDGMILVRRSVAQSMLGDENVKPGHNAITRYFFHTRNSKGRTGWSIAKGLTIVVDDALLDAHPMTCNCDIIFNEYTLKINTVPDGIVERAIFQICSEVKGHSSNAIASQVSCQLLGDISKKSKVDAFEETNRVLCNIIKDHYELFNKGLKDPEMAIIFAGLTRKQRTFFEKQRADFFVEKLLKVGGVNKTLVGELLYWNEGTTRFDKIRRENKFHCNSENLLMIQDPAFLFVDLHQYVDSGTLAFNLPVENIVLEARNSSFDGIYDVFYRGMDVEAGKKIIGRYPLNAMGQLVQANALSKQAYKDMIKDRLPEGNGNLKTLITNLCMQIKGIVMSGLGIIDPQLGGGDFDGDRCVLILEELINQLIDSELLPVIAMDSNKKAPKLKFTKENWTKVILTSLDVNAVGILANWGSAWADVYMLCAGKVQLPQCVIEVLVDITKRAKHVKNDFFQDSLEIIQSISFEKLEDFYENGMKLAQEMQIVIASLEMQAIDSAKDGKGVDLSIYEWVIPGIPKYRSKVDGKVRYDFIIPSWFKYNYLLKKKIVEPSNAKIIYESVSPFGNMMNLCEEYLDDIQTKLRNVKGRSKLLFSHREAEVAAFVEFFVDLGDEFSDKAIDLVRKYADEDDKFCLSDEIAILQGRCRTILESREDFPSDDESLACAIEGYYSTQVSKGKVGKFQMDFAIELFGDCYLRELTRLNGGLVASATLVRSIKNRLTSGEFAVSDRIVYDADGQKIGRASLPIADGLYSISRLNGGFYLTTTTEDEISDVIGHQLRLFSDKRSGGHTGQELHQAIVANGGIINIRLEGRNAVVHIGNLTCHLGDKGPNVAGFKLQVRVSDIKASSITATIIGRGDSAPAPVVNRDLGGNEFTVAVVVQPDVCSYREIEHFLDNKLGLLLKTKKLVISSADENVVRYCENRHITLSAIEGPMSYAFFHDGSFDHLVEMAKTKVANPTRVMNKVVTLTPPVTDKKTFRVIIAGGKDFNNYELLKASCLKLLVNKLQDSNVVIFSGGAIGADTLAIKFAKEMNLPFKVFEADWENKGKGAGMIRNKEMLLYADATIAFWDGKSAGTKNMIDITRMSGKIIKTIGYGQLANV